MSTPRKLHWHKALLLFAANLMIFFCSQAFCSETNYREIGSDAFVYGDALVRSYQYLYNSAVNSKSSQFMAPLNAIYNISRTATPDDIGITVPNCDTPYSWLWMDLRTEPLVISVPSIPSGRYYSVQLSDLNMFNFGYIGSRTTGNEAGDFLVIGPEWKGESYPGIKKIFRSSSYFAMGLFRTQLFSSTDLKNAIAIQDGYKVQPLSRYLGTPPPPSAPKVNFPEFNGSTGYLGLDNFFTYLNFVLSYNVPFPEEENILRNLAKIGVGPYKQFNYESLSDAQKSEVLLGMQDGINKRDNYIMKGGIKLVRGWGLANIYGSREFFKGDWLRRAAGAWNGCFGNSAEEALYPGIFGKTLDCSKHKYTLTFEKDSFPPVNAFWSVTMYDLANKQLVQNPINRYLINSAMLPELKKNEDGSLTIYVQHQAPDDDKRMSNWLPAPNGQIYMVLRMYWPKQAGPSILPPGEGSWNPPPLVQVD
jgi:hypothetical protein